MMDKIEETLYTCFLFTWVSMYGVKQSAVVGRNNYAEQIKGLRDLGYDDIKAYGLTQVEVSK